MVRITIVARDTAESQSLVVSYEDNSNTIAVKDDLARAFGNGHLRRNGVGALTETLTGDYEFHITRLRALVGTKRARGDSDLSDSTSESLAADANAAVSAIVRQFPKSFSKAHSSFDRSLSERFSRFPPADRLIYIGRLQSIAEKCKMFIDREEIISLVEEWEADMERKNELKKQKLN